MFTRCVDNVSFDKQMLMKWRETHGVWLAGYNDHQVWKWYGRKTHDIHFSDYLVNDPDGAWETDQCLASHPWPSLLWFDMACRNGHFTFPCEKPANGVERIIA
ncbi:hypothetical protein EB796_013144 [Bugula neritina]|uniref:C-type lectin domain-containing protein n=1 Tax=Bugula neritina TaxID=10212 RepID=A0A7J7JSC0_BUGNE|nr:hypothetical protein EB796_013144 [Bugula neritina]